MMIVITVRAVGSKAMERRTKQHDDGKLCKDGDRREYRCMNKEIKK
jgi:hypothetical protein